jgi:hypothetical protein
MTFGFLFMQLHQRVTKPGEKMDKQNNNLPFEGKEAKRAYVYSGFSQRDHNTLCSPTAWDDRRVADVLEQERRQEVIHAVADCVIYALFGAMLVFAYYS